MTMLGFADPQARPPVPPPESTPASPPEPVDPPPQQPPEPPHGDERASVGDEVNTVLMALLPWGISFLFHAGLVLLAVFALWSTVAQDAEEEVIVPLVRLSATPGAPLQVRTEQRVRQQTSSSRRVIQPTQTASQQNTLNTRVNTETALIGVAGMSGKSSPFGTTISSGAEFKTTFIGSGGNARKIAFLIDASGSLIDTLPFVITELKKTINQLSEKQQFTVIFFQGDQVIEVPPPGFKDATGEAKQKVVDWIDLSNHNITPRGSSNPVPALERAMRYKPQLIFLLSDNITGRDQYAVDQRRLLAAIEKANTAGTKINTLQFLYPDPLAKIGLKGTMELIAQDSGGVYKFVDGRELGLQEIQ